MSYKYVLNKISKKFLVIVMPLTAYVCGKRGGLILEDPHCFGVSLNGVPGLDIDIEKKLVEEKLNQLQANGALQQDIDVEMKNFGIER
jgi:fatty acyl-CoA reductase